MKILFYLHHPAQFHLFKNTIRGLKERGHEIQIIASTKDILEELLSSEGFEYKNFLPKGRVNNSKLSMGIEFIVQDWRLLKLCISNRPDLMVGTSKEVCHIGKLLNIDNIFFCEDDVELIPLLAKFALPYAKSIMAPNCCNFGEFESKKIGYSGYHESAYLHPNNFEVSDQIAMKYIDIDKPYFIIRFVKFTAHHDIGITGITKEIALKIISLLKPNGNIYITSERELDPELEKYRMKIEPKDIHHVMAKASMYIGDSQSMAMEAGTLGVPFIRFNDFVGRISVLEELENHYDLGFGIPTDKKEELYSTISNLLKISNLREIYQEKRQRMLNDTIDLNEYLIDYFEKRIKENKK